MLNPQNWTTEIDTLQSLYEQAFVELIYIFVFSEIWCRDNETAMTCWQWCVINHRIYIITRLKLTRHHDVVQTRATRAILILRTTADCSKRCEVVDFVEVSPLIVAVVMICIGASVRILVWLNDWIRIINLLLSLMLILFWIRVLIWTRLKLNGIIIIFGFVCW